MHNYITVVIKKVLIFDNFYVILFQLNASVGYFSYYCQ